MCDPCKRSSSSPQRGYSPHVENHGLRGKAVKEPGMEVKLSRLDLPNSCPLLSPPWWGVAMCIPPSVLIIELFVKDGGQ